MRLCAFFALLVPFTFVAAISPPPTQAQQATVLPTPAPPGLGLGPVSSYTLENGLRVLVAPSSAADLVTLDVWMGAGTRRETADNNGEAHFIEHLLFKGTPTRKAGDIDAAIEDLGGSLNAATSYDWAHFYVTVASADADSALAVLSDALMNATIRPEDMEAERPVILSEMAREEAQPTGRLTQAFNALTFPTHPYGRPLLGTTATITQMTRQTVYDFYKTYYVPGNATLVIAGNVTPEQGLAMARKALGAWPTHPVPADTVVPEPLQSDIRARTLNGSFRNAYVTLGFRAPSVQNQPDAWMMDVLLTELGQGGNNRLQQDLQRKRKLVTSINANFLTQHDPGTLSITAECEPGRVDEVVKAILAEVQSLRDVPLSDAALAAAKHALLASYLFDAQTDSGRAGALGFYAVIASAQYDTDYIGHFEAVTAAQVQSVAQKYLTPQAYTLVTLLPRTDPVTASRR